MPSIVLACPAYWCRAGARFAPEAIDPAGMGERGAAGGAGLGAGVAGLGAAAAFGGGGATVVLGAADGAGGVPETAILSNSSKKPDNCMTRAVPTTRG